MVEATPSFTFYQVRTNCVSLFCWTKPGVYQCACFTGVARVKPQGAFKSTGPSPQVHVPQTQKVKVPPLGPPHCLTHLVQHSCHSKPRRLPHLPHQCSPIPPQPTHQPTHLSVPTGHFLPPNPSLTRQQGTHTVVAVLELFSGVSSPRSSSIVA